MNEKQTVRMMDVIQGICAGMIMALVLLEMMKRVSFVMNPLNIFLFMLISSAMPLCLFFASRQAKMVMTAVSFLIICLYGGFVSYTTGEGTVNYLFASIFLPSCLMHAASVMTVLLSEKFRK